MHQNHGLYATDPNTHLLSQCEHVFISIYLKIFIEFVIVLLLVYVLVFLATRDVGS